MAILVLNSGSSSIKFSMFDLGLDESPECLLDGELSGVGGGDAAMLHVQTAGKTGLRADAFGKSPHSVAEAIEAIFEMVTGSGMPVVGAIGYRVVHPGAKLTDHTRITNEVMKDIVEATAFAPLHEPAAIEVIRAGMARFATAAHFACFDTVFHRTMPEEARTYALPESVRGMGVQRYGFHGLSCESVLHQLKDAKMPIPKRMAIAHLGSGCSVTAVRDGVSIDTTMGLTPAGGVVMGTRPGDLDPGLMLYLIRQEKGGVEAAASAVESMLNHHSGMAALTGLPNDMKAVRQASEKGNGQATLALKIFTRSITKALGAYCFLLGGLDAIVFIGGIGEHDGASRAEILADLTRIGVELDIDRNLTQESDLRMIHASKSMTAIFVAPAQENLMIALHVARMAGREK